MAVKEVQVPTRWDIPKFTLGDTGSEFAIYDSPRSQKVLTIYDHRAINWMAEWFKFRVRNKHDNIIMITGERRTGKSHLGGQLSRAIDPAFPVKNCAFPLEEFNRILRDNPRADPEHDIYPVIMLDEAGYDLYAGNWMQRIQKNMVRKFEVIGEKRQTVLLVLPHQLNLIKGIRGNIAKFWINVETWGRNEERGVAVLRVANPNIWELSPYWEAVIAFHYDEVLDDWWNEYLIKKRAFVDLAAAEDPSVEKGSKRYSKFEMGSMQLMSEEAKAGKTQEYLAHRYHIDQAEVSRRLKIVNG